MNLCKCGCGCLVKKNWCKGHYIRVYNPLFRKDIQEKLRIANTGKTWSKERRIIMSKAAKKHNFGKWMIGKKHTEETKIKISIAHKKPENIEKIRKIHLGKKATQEQKNKYKKAANAPERIKSSRLGALKSFIILKRKNYSNTKPELEMKIILEELKIPFQQWFPVDFIKHCYACDFFIPDFKLIIEVDGKYWHNYPYGRNIDLIRNEEIKIAGYNILRFWEDEFDKNIVENKIKEIVINMYKKIDIIKGEQKCQENP